jgi:hypothetical protein
MKCEICRIDEVSEKHHLVPRSRGGKETIECCSDCGGQVHMLFNNAELAGMSLDDLVKHEKMEKYIVWKQKHPGAHKHRMSKEVKQWKRGHR